MKQLIIAIDGFSSTGKSSIAKALAKKLKYSYIDTGAMYRAVTLYALQHQIIGTDFFNKNELIDNLKNIELSFEINENTNTSEIHLNGNNVENEIRTLTVSNFVSIVAAVSQVRSKLVKSQQELGKKKAVVMDGRDIGTVVFPNADLKIFMTASAEERSKRRTEELKSKGQKVSYEEVYKNIIERDSIDVSRDDSPLVKAEDAIAFDNTNLNFEEQLQKILVLVKDLQ